MAQIRIDLDDDEDRKVELYKAENRLGSKEEAIKRIIKTYPLVAGEQDLYGVVSRWFVENKNCQADEFSRGYAINEEMDGGYRPDIVAMRYELTSNETPSIDFYGYVVEVKLKEEDILRDLTKVRLYIKKSKSGELLANGFNYVSFYVAFAKEGIVDQSLLDICKEDGIGILQLNVSEGKVNDIYEIVKPKTIQLGGMSHKEQQSPGTFEESIKNLYLRKILKNPSGMYSSLIMPKKTRYEENNKLERLINAVKDSNARNALELTLDKLKQFDHYIPKKSGGAVFTLDIGTVKIRPASKYFYIDTSWNGTTYRVNSKEEILEGSGGSLTKSSSNLDGIIKNIISSSTSRRPKVLVVGIGGAGNNIVRSLAGKGIEGAEFAAINTDAEHLGLINNVSSKLLIGADITHGRGVGGNRELGEKAATTDKDPIEKLISGYNLVFLCAGLGGGTGSGATPVVAKLAKEKGIRTIAVVSMPFSLESQRLPVAEESLSKLRKTCDNVVAMENDKLVEIMPEKSMSYAFNMLDENIAIAINELIGAYAAILPFTDYNRR